MEPRTSQRTVAAFGTWSSPITAEMITRGGRSLFAPWLADDAAWWLEGRPAEGGRVVLVRSEAGSGPEDVTPPDLNVRTMVHEYGGGAYSVHGGVVFCSHFGDQRLYRQEPGEQPVPISPAIEGRRHRYADGRVTADGSLWIGVRERHEPSGRADEVVNELVALPTDGSAAPRVIAGGRDFYAAPRISPDGSRLCYLAWSLPWMPWDGCELFVAELEDGGLSNPTLVAGQEGVESIWQPDWSPTGELVFASDRSGWWNLEAVRDGERRILYAAEAEFGYPAWTLGGRSYGFLADGRIVCTHDRDGRTTLGVLDPRAGDLRAIDLPHDSIGGLCAEGSTVLFVGGSPTIPTQVVRLDVSSGSSEVLRTSTDVPVDARLVSVPRAIEFPTERGLTAHAFHYPPTNPGYAAPVGERPPLIVTCHGGPTSNTTPTFDLRTQFWTSRGFGLVDVNYGGSTGYGRAYRERLNGQWGVVDLEDCVNAGRYLAGSGEADPARLLIRGGSAGGYTVICALTFTDEFAGGTSYYGVADLEPFATGETHKFESRYEHLLVGPYPEAADVYRARSPIHFADRITTPMLVLQGAEDEIVPPSQAESIVAALRERGIPHAYLLYGGEGHGFRKAETIVSALQAELSFYAQLLRFEPGDPLPKLEIEHLGGRTWPADWPAAYHSPAMQSFVIEGGRPLSGTVRAAGNKNGALPILAATVLASEPVTLSNVPRIRDVETMVELLADIGAAAAWTGANEVRVDPSGVAKTDLDPELCREIRASFLLAGPLLARFGACTVPPPGGDVIGRRRLDTHIHAFAELGVEVELNGGYAMRVDRLVGTRLYLDEASVMGTENAIMAAVTAEGGTVVGHAACEPHIQDLCRFLVALGAEIEGIGSNVLHIAGVERLGGGEYRVGSDHIEVASFAALGALTGGEVTIEDVEPDDLISIVPAFRKLGINLEVGETSVRVPAGQDLRVEDDLGGQIPKIESGIWPAFPADLTSIAVTAATQARGTVLIFEKMFESRLFFVDKLVSMGARIILCDPHRAVVTGPARLYGERLESPDIRAGMAMLIAALCAEGRSSIGNIRQIDRGYERIDDRLRALGAQIERADL